MAGTSMRWQTGFGRCHLPGGPNGGEEEGSIQREWGWVGAAKEGLLHLSLQEERHGPEAHRGCLRGIQEEVGHQSRGESVQAVRGPGTAGLRAGQAQPWELARPVWAAATELSDHLLNAQEPSVRSGADTPLWSPVPLSPAHRG